MKKKRKLIIGILILLLLIAIGVLRYRYVNSVEYQMNKLTRGSAREKNIAADFMADNKVYEAIPLLVRNVDNEDRDFWDKDPKGGRIQVSCAVTSSLAQLTGQKLGNTCIYHSGEKTEEDLETIRQAWKDWYESTLIE